MIMKRIFAFMLLTFLLSVVPVIAQEEGEEADSGSAIPSGVDGYISLDNNSTESWRIIDFGGEGVYVSTGGLTVQLEVDREYYIDLSNVNSEMFPMDIKNGRGDVLISQREDIDTVEIEGIDASVDEEGIRFILNEELAQEISIFRAAPYPAMVGFLSAVVVDETAASEEENEEE